MEGVKQNIERGTPVAMAVRAELLARRGLSVWAFADKHGVPRAGMSAALNGNQRPTDAMIAALIAELGGTEEEWREMLWLAGKPEHVGKVKIAR